MSDEQEQEEDPLPHIRDWEWLYQHGYLDDTFYGARRRLYDASEPIRRTFSRPLYWLADRIDAGLAWLTRLLRRHV